MPTGTAPVTPTTTGTRINTLRFPASLTGTLVGRELAELMSEHRTRVADVQRLRRERDELAQRGGRRAQAADADALARALRSGGKDPGPVAVKEHAAALADAERQVAGAQRALALVEQDVRNLLAERGPAYLADVTELHTAARARLADAIAAVHEAMNEEQTLRATALWLRSGKPTPGSVLYVPGLTHGTPPAPYTLPAVLDALAAALADAAR